MIESDERAHLNEVADELRLPLIVKPPNEGSTIGISRVRGYSEMADAFQLARKYDDVVLAEEFIDGQELTCAILGEGGRAEALPLVEIRAPLMLTTTITTSTSARKRKYLCPAPIDAALSETIRNLSVRAYNALGARGWGRIDIMLSRAQ